jgi:RimJ/RimL family protein N-acetyltransferase
MSHRPQSVVPVPVVETERLRLRGHRLDDFGECAAMWADPTVTRYIGGRPFTEEESWARLLRYVGHWSWLGFGYWAMEEKATGGFIGELGFADFKREIEPSIQGLPELGWVLAARAHGKGYATEAARAVLSWGEASFDSGKTVCLIHPDNRASLRVAEKCGFEESLRTTYKGHPTILLNRGLKNWG